MRTQRNEETVTLPKGEHERLLKYKEIAIAYLDIARCKICGSPHPDGFVCYFCGEDDSDPEEFVAQIQES